MTDEQINETIAQEIGWHYVDGWHHEDGREGLPDVCNDPKAMEETEDWLICTDRESFDEYCSCFVKTGISASVTRQRAENFLKVLGKLVE